MLITMELSSWHSILLFVSVSGLLVRASGQGLGPNAEASLAGDYDDDGEGGDYLDIPHDSIGHQEPEKSLEFVRDLRNVTREQGESLKVRCEVEGSPPANRFKWFFNEAPLHEEAGRIKIKTNVKGSSSQFSVLRFQELKFLDKGYYRCEASNDYDTVKKTFVINVVLNTGRKSKYGQDSDFLHIPDHRSYEDAFSALNSLSNGIDGLPDHIASEHGVISSSFVSGHGSAAAAELPSLKPDEKVGRCEKYTGSACGGSHGEAMVWVSTDQTYVDERLSLTFQTITTSKMMSSRCSEYAIQAICHSTFPLCDKRTQRPRKLCREECEVLEADYCKSELETARSHPAIFQQLVFPECEELPALGSMDSHNCVRLGIPGTSQLLQPHSCYNGAGSSYRGTHSMTSSGQHCKPWREQRVIPALPDNKELVGGHNYCRNPAGDQEMDEPWCFTDDRNNIKQVCGLPQCSDFSVMLYVVLPAAVALVMVAVLLGVCCLRQTHKKPLSVAASSPSRSFINPSAGNSHHNYSEMEMNSLLPPGTGNLHTQVKVQKVRAREFPISAVRFVHEMGDGVFGKVYRGELGGIVGGVTSLVAVKTLKPGATQQTRTDFQRESEMMADLRHPNIVCLLGVVSKDEPACLIFEWMPHGDLHEYLLSHSPKTDLAFSLGGSVDGEADRILDHGDMSYIAIQIASGMEYLAQHQYVHRDLASRNCLVGQNMVVKISDFGLSRDIYAADYYRMQTKSLVPLRWMPPESIFFGKFSAESDVWSYGVLLWEVYSYGLQPYYGYSNQEVIEMIRSRQLLPCPEDCPSRMYAFMVECWHELPNKRPSFTEIHARLRQWEGMSCGYQSTHSNSQSMCGQSDKSTSQHSSTGPSNNTGSTSLSQNQYNNPGGYSRPFQHLAAPPALPQGMGMTMATMGGPQGVHSKLVGQLGPYSGHAHSSNSTMSGMSNMYTPLVNIGPGGGAKSVASGQHSVASLQMV